MDEGKPVSGEGEQRAEGLRSVVSRLGEGRPWVMAMGVASRRKRPTTSCLRTPTPSRTARAATLSRSVLMNMRCVVSLVSPSQYSYCHTTDREKDAH